MIQIDCGDGEQKITACKSTILPSSVRTTGLAWEFPISQGCWEPGSPEIHVYSDRMTDKYMWCQPNSSRFSIAASSKTEFDGAVIKGCRRATAQGSGGVEGGNTISQPTFMRKRG